MDINFNDGRKEYKVNGNIIKINVGDIGMVSRIEKGQAEIQEIIDNLPQTTENELKHIEKLEKKTREAIDNMLDFPVCDTVFGKTSLFALTDGEMLVTLFLEALMPVLVKDIEEETKKFEQNISKYTSQLKE